MARILIVDDSLIMRKNLRTILHQAGHEIVGEADTGREAVNQYILTQPDLVTMDITMPVMDGIDAVNEIISKYPDAKIIMVSALQQKQKVFEAMERGAKHYILKPINTQKVINIVNQVLKNNTDNPIKIALTRTPPSELDHPCSITPLFSVENKDGVFIVKFLRDPDEEGLKSLQTAIQGFLFLKPLKIIFDYTHIKDIQPKHMDLLDEMIIQIRSVGGEFSVNAQSPSLLQMVRKYGV
jgi:CheY-like chemotaxis protein